MLEGRGPVAVCSQTLSKTNDRTDRFANLNGYVVARAIVQRMAACRT